MRYLVGVGGYLAGDDGVGPRVVDYVLENGLDQDLEAIDLSTDAVSLVAYLDDDTEAVLVVDAAHLGLAPGDFRVFSPEQVETRKELGGLTTHEGDVLKVLELAREAGYSGVGVYSVSGFVHVDVREQPHHWVDASGPGATERPKSRARRKSKKPGKG